MQVIPVIDLMHGQVVHAKKGERQHYRPIESPICQSSAPMDIIEALLGLYPFKRLYIADIDAIQKRGHHREIILDIQRVYPGLEIWLDAGLSSTTDLATWETLDVQMIVGSESLPDLGTYHTLAQNLNSRFILSIDFNMEGYQGPGALLTDTNLWPDNVIVMALQQVGSNAGPAFDKLQAHKTQSPRTNIYAAGGTRHIGDIEQLHQMHISGALVASALHTGQIGAMELGKLQP
ncbi:nickel transporter [Methylobacillus caricis]|uniref:HisA/HisF-related TIM barrel protein n=1 Tax=Methylobacillus caricis TaxID=1971611 RepID=UPI001CFFEAEE|nr:HisA/HisF-related TIM barrel protein [Methylobacillus caricis]MCB5187284.1 nickel transporter [Methylobacillus caricis]